MHISCAFKDMLHIVAFTGRACVTIQWHSFLLHSRVRKSRESLRNPSETASAAADGDHSTSYLLQKKTIVRLLFS